MKETIAEVMAFTVLATIPTDYGRSNFVSTEGTVAPEKTQTEGMTPGAAEAKEGGTKAVPYKFAFLPNTQSSTFQAAMNDAFKKLCDEKGYDYAYLDLDCDLNAQLSQMADVTTQDFDAIFVIPVDSAGIRQGPEQIHEKNIPILDVNTPVINNNLGLIKTVTATDAYNVEALVGRRMITDYPDGVKVAILDFPSSESRVNHMADFLDGPSDAKDKSDIVTQQDGMTTLDVSIPIVEDITQTNPDLDAFFCINDPSALSAMTVIKVSNKMGISAYSADVSPDDKVAILDGPSMAVMAQVPAGIAETTFEETEELLTDGEIKKGILLPSFLIGEEKAEATLEDWQ